MGLQRAGQGATFKGSTCRSIPRRLFLPPQSLQLRGRWRPAAGEVVLVVEDGEEAVRTNACIAPERMKEYEVLEALGRTAGAGRDLSTLLGGPA